MPQVPENHAAAPVLVKLASRQDGEESSPRPQCPSLWPHLQQLEGSQQIPSRGIASVDLVVLELGWEAGWAVRLVGHLHQGLGKGPAHEVGFALT